MQDSCMIPLWHVTKSPVGIQSSEKSRILAGAVQVYDLLVACGWMAGGNTSGPSAAGHRADGQPMPGSAGIVKCDPLEGQWPPGFNTIGNLQSFPGFHPGPFQM